MVSHALLQCLETFLRKSALDHSPDNVGLFSEAYNDAIYQHSKIVVVIFILRN